MKIKVSLIILNEDGVPMMGKGTIWLLQRIRRLRSINQAAKEMEMSYVKALKILKDIEATLGQEILIKRIGGKDHGGAELTPFAEEFLALFESYQTTVTDFAEQAFQRFREQTNQLKEKYDEKCSKSD